MSKQKFSNLNRGRDKIESALSSFVINKSDKPAFNPLKEKRPKAKEEEKPAAAEPQEMKVKEAAAAPGPEVNTPPIKIKEKKIPEPTKVDQEEAEVKVLKKKKEVARVGEGMDAETALIKDFRPHSALFSSDQLNNLRKVVNYKKWKENPKYSIQQAIFEAISMLLKKRTPLSNFPDDFITYSPAFSEGQYNILLAYIGEVKFKENDRYALKYALYEAIDYYLRKNRIE